MRTIPLDGALDALLFRMNENLGSDSFYTKSISRKLVKS